MQNSFLSSWQRFGTLSSDNITDCNPGIHHILFLLFCTWGGGGVATWPSAEAYANGSLPGFRGVVFEVFVLKGHCASSMNDSYPDVSRTLSGAETLGKWRSTTSQTNEDFEIKSVKKSCSEKKYFFYVNSQLFGCVKNCERRPLASTLPLSTSNRMKQLGSHWTDFHEILYTSIFRKPVEKNSSFTKIWQNSGYLTWQLTYIDDNISPNSSQNEKYSTQKL